MSYVSFMDSVMSPRLNDAVNPANPIDNVVDLNLYRRQREIAKNCVRSRVPLYVSHLDGEVNTPQDSITSRMASIDAQIEELDDLIYLLNQDTYPTYHR